jgi:hypothetical protein
MKAKLLVISLISVIVCKGQTPTPTIIAGDWEGTGRMDTLYEYYYSRALKREVVSPLFLYKDQIDYDSLVRTTLKLDPIIYIINKSYPMDTITIDGNGQLFGVYFLNNKGDLDGDGGDELAYMACFADYSNTNTYHIYSRKNGKWVNLYSFPVWEWQFEEGDQHVIQKLPENKIKITFRNNEAMEETKIVALDQNGKDKYYLVIDTALIQLNSIERNNFNPKWVDKMEFRTDPKYRNIYGNKRGDIYIYPKKRFKKKLLERYKYYTPGDN